MIKTETSFGPEPEAIQAFGWLMAILGLGIAGWISARMGGDGGPKPPNPRK